MLVGSRALLALVLQTSVVGTTVGPGPEDPGSLIERGDAAAEAGRPAEAADAYSQYYASLPPQTRASPAGLFVVESAVESYLLAYQATSDARLLHQAHALLDAFTTLVDAAHPGADKGWTEPAVALRKRVEELQSEAEPEPEPEPGPGPVAPSVPLEPTSAPGPDEQPGPRPPVVDRDPVVELEPSDGASSRRDRVGLGLAIGGGAVMAAGLGVLIAGTQYGPVAERRVDEDGPENFVDADGYIADAEDAGTTAMIVGGAVLAVGTAALTWGIVRLVRRRRGTARTRFGALVGRDGPGISIRGRF